MFENIIGQEIIERIKFDITGGTLPPSILFCGPQASAKGSAALELARALSCEKLSLEGGGAGADGADGAGGAAGAAAWDCKCSSCRHHRTLSHPDLIALGPRNFRAEIAACRAVFLSDTGKAAARTLFIRAVRKLLLRFSPVLWEGEPKISKLSGFIEKISDSIEELLSLTAAQSTSEKKIEKTCDEIVKNCVELESEGISLLIPVGQIRRAAYWLRLAPNGRRKTLIIENADKMNDAARNSLLKILEEPPRNVTILLTSAHHKALLATILSRLRHYNFAQRSTADETKVLKSIFRQEIAADGGENQILRFQNSFLPASRESLIPAAAFFWSSMAALAIVEGRKRAAALTGAPCEPDKTLVALGSFCAPLAEAGGFPKHELSIKALIPVLCKTAAGFKPRSLFPLFIELLCETLLNALRGAAPAGKVRIHTAFKRHAEEVRNAVEVFNQAPALSLQRLTFELRKELGACGA